MEIREEDVKTPLVSERRAIAQSMSSCSKCSLVIFIVADVAAVVFMGIAMAKMFGPIGSHAHVGAMVGGGIVSLISTGGIIFIAARSCQKDSRVKAQTSSNDNLIPIFQLVKSERVGNEDEKSVYVTSDGTFVTYPKGSGKTIKLFKDKGKSQLEEVPKEYEKSYVLHSFDNTNMVVASGEYGIYRGIFLIDIKTNQSQEIDSQAAISDRLAIGGDYIARETYHIKTEISNIEIWSISKKEVIRVISAPKGLSFQGLVIIGDKLFCLSKYYDSAFPKVKGIYSLPDGKLLYDSGQESKNGKGQFRFQSESFLGENIIFEKDRGLLEIAKTHIYSLDGSKLVELPGRFDCLTYDKAQNLLVLSHQIDIGVTEIVFWSLTENKSLQKLKIKEIDASIRGAKFIGDELFLYGSVPEKNSSCPFTWKFELLQRANPTKTSSKADLQDASLNPGKETIEEPSSSKGSSSQNLFQFVKRHSVGNESKKVYVTSAGDVFTYSYKGNEIKSFTKSESGYQVSVTFSGEEELNLHRFDDNLMAARSSGGVVVRSLDSTSVRLAISGYDDVRDLAIKGDYLAILCTKDGKSAIEIWSIQAKSIMRTISPERWVTQIFILKDNLFCNLLGGSASVYALSDKKEKKEFSLNLANPYYGDNLIYGYDHSLKKMIFLSPLKGDEIARLDGEMGCYACDEEQKFLVIGRQISEQCEIDFWSIEEKRSLYKFTIPEKDWSVGGGRFVGKNFVLNGSIKDEKGSHPSLWEFKFHKGN